MVGYPVNDWQGLLARTREAAALLKFHAGRHAYYWNGKNVPGVTTITRTMAAPALVKWMVRVQAEATARYCYNLDGESFMAEEDAFVKIAVAMAARKWEHERLANEAADVGKQAHALIEQECKRRLSRLVLSGDPYDRYSEAALWRFESWKAWAASVDFAPLAAEERVFHPTEGYAGTVDLIALVNGEVSLWDWKPPGERVYPEQRLQSAAYRKALVAHGWPEMPGYILRLPDDGSTPVPIQMCAGPALEETYRSFLALLRVSRWLKTTR